MDISVSQLGCYKQCRRLYYLKYKLGLEPVQTAEALITGSNYHEMVEKISRGEEVDFPRSALGAMLWAYSSFIAPKIDVAEQEKWFKYPLPGGRHNLIGRFDGITSDGVIVEHKTTSSPIDESYIYNLQFNDQIKAYLLASGRNTLWYTSCSKPKLRQKKDETEEEYFQRCCSWFENDTDSKIRLFEQYRTQEELKNFETEVAKIADEIEACTLFFRNPANCSTWSGCPYRSICPSEHPQPGLAFQISEWRRPEDI